jgi:hypothetical protein
MILARCIRQFETPEGVIELAKDATFTAAPTMGTRLRFPGEPLHLEVVGVILDARPTAPGVSPPSVTLMLWREDAARMEAAQAQGWRRLDLDRASATRA